MSRVALEVLTEINIDDMLRVWGLDQRHALLRAAARAPSVAFARELERFDAAVGRGGLRAGGELMCRRYTGGVRAAGLENVPANGPLLVLSNHPGMADTVALFVSIPRDGLRVIALDRPFLRALPHSAEQLFMLPDDPNRRAGVTRAVTSFLRQGGTALTFPAGQIEPDPLVQPGARESLDSWSESIGLFARLVPQLSIVVALVGGVVTPAALHHPLTRLRRAKKDQELVGASLQLVWRGYQRNVVSVAFAPPLRAQALLAGGRDPAAITRAVTDAARGLLDHWPCDWHTLL